MQNVGRELISSIEFPISRSSRIRLFLLPFFHHRDKIAAAFNTDSPFRFGFTNITNHTRKDVIYRPPSTTVISSHSLSVAAFQVWSEIAKQYFITLHKRSYSLHNFQISFIYFIYLSFCAKRGPARTFRFRNFNIVKRNHLTQKKKSNKIKSVLRK